MSQPPAPAPGRGPTLTQSHPGPPRGGRLGWLSLAALGVVFGDIGTSPLYALEECLAPATGLGLGRPEILGVLSLVFWALFAVVTVKYLGFILRADNQGEGGVLALAALIGLAGRGRGRRALVALGLFGAALLYGDAMITPAITVLSAYELEPTLQPFAVPCALATLLVLFLVQARGTARVGAVFGPIMLAWFVVLALLGLRQIGAHPEVLAALDPRHAGRFLLEHGAPGFFLLGMVFLVVTGAEALYADMGHFGRRPIRLAWVAVVLPALLLNYFGQGALLLDHPEAIERPLFAMAPPGWRVPLLVLAVLASAIAAQAVISGTFSLTRQAVQLGYAPRMRIVHTSAEEIGQIYVPEVNTLLLLATSALVLGFGSAGALASAYGMAVTTTMLITTLLFGVVAHRQFHWPRLVVALVLLPFLVVDLAFFGANLLKVFQGGWVSLVVGGAIFVLMSTWKVGREHLAARMRATLPTIRDFIALVKREPVPRVDGWAVFLTGNVDLTPPGLLHNLKHNRVVHRHVVFLTVVTDEVPRVAPERRVELQELGDGFHAVIGRYGFMEDPDVPELLRAARERGLAVPVESASFFLSRQRVLPSGQTRMPLWRQKLFALMTRNTLGATTFYHIPPGQVVELGAQVHL